MPGNTAGYVTPGYLSIAMVLPEEQDSHPHATRFTTPRLGHPEMVTRAMR